MTEACFGKELTRLRESSGYSLEEIAKLTRINSVVLRDLEAGDTESSGGAVYARGHIRTIAQVMGADATELLELFDAKDAPDNRPMIELLEENNATVASKPKSAASPKVVAIAASVAIGIAIIIPSGLALASKSSHKAAPKKVVKVDTKVVTTTPSHDVVISATGGATWVSVNDANGALIFSGMLQQGSSRSFPNGTVSMIRVGNAGVTSLVVDGKNYGSLGNVGEVKTISLIPNGAATSGQ